MSEQNAKTSHQNLSPVLCERNQNQGKYSIPLGSSNENNLKKKKRQTLPVISDWIM